MNNKIRDYFSFGLQNFIQGLVILSPIVVTIWSVLFLFNSVDNLLPNLIHSIVPNYVEKDSEGNLIKIPGLGFIVVVLLVIIVGKISTSFFVERFLNFLEGILEKTPGVKFIYTSVKDIFDAFAGNKKKFDKPVLIDINGTGIWQLGFITQEHLMNFDLEDHVSVVIPYSYSISGNLFLIPKSRIKFLEKIAPAEAMKFAISGGVSEV